MLQDGISRWTVKSMRWIGVSILIMGIASLVFGILLLVAANTVHDEEVEQLEMELQPTSIGELKDLRETIRDSRYDQIEPEDVSGFIEGYLANLYMESLSMSEGPSATDDLKWEAWNDLLTQEKGLSLGLLTLGTARMATYAGIGTVIISAGLIMAGLLAIGVGPSISQIVYQRGK